MLKQLFFRPEVTSNPSYDEGIITEVVRQGYKWRVAARGSYWKATSPKPIVLDRGDPVWVIGERGIGLIIDQMQNE
jgi:membrane protein implicated in regulation of membrane protease activity